MKNLIPKRVMEYVIITFAVILMDVGIYVFKFPNNFSFGGVSGMAVVFAHFIPMTSAQINLIINLILLVIGFIILGRDFGVKTAYVTVVSSLLLNVFEKVFPMERALTGNIMLELCFAIILPALAAALLFFENASGGGTDIVAMIIKNYERRDKMSELGVDQESLLTHGTPPCCTSRVLRPLDVGLRPIAEKTKGPQDKYKCSS